MDGYSAVASADPNHAGEQRIIYQSRTPRTGKRGVVLCHGATLGADGSSAWSSSYSLAMIAGQLSSAGFTLVAVDLGPADEWGNATSVSRFGEAVTLLGTLGCATDKVCAVANSMGFSDAVHYAIANPTKVARIVGITPGWDITDAYVNNTAGLQADIGTAWGVTYPTPLPANADASANNNYAPIVTAGIPGSLYYSTADTVIPPSTVLDCSTKLGWPATVISTTEDHTNGDLRTHVPVSDVAAQLIASGA